MAAVSAGGRESQLLDRAVLELAKHNYKRSLKLAEEVLAGSPAGAELTSARRLKAFSLCGLRDRDGYDYAKSVMAESPALAADADLWFAMGDDRFNRWHRKKAYECYAKAAGLFEDACRYTRAADAHLKAVECLLARRDILPAQQETENWQEKQRAGVDEVLRLCDHVAELKIDDGRKAGALLTAGKAAGGEGSWDYAQWGLERLAKAAEQFPRTAAAPQAQFEKGQVYERFNRFVEAVNAYQKAVTNFPNSAIATQARECIDQIKAPKVTIMVTQPYLPGRAAELYWQSRNIKRLNLTAWHIDLGEALTRASGSTGGLTGISDLAKWRGPRAAQWTFATPDEGKHRYYRHLPDPAGKRSTTAIPVPLTKAGAYIVKAQGVNAEKKPAESFCVLILSELSAVAKADVDEALVFVAGTVDGGPVEGASVVVARRWSSRARGHDCAAGLTNEMGVARIGLPEVRSYSWLAAIKKGDDQAICARGRYYWSWWGYGRRHKVYGFTARPVYRPGQTVNFKEILRRHEEGAYVNLPGAAVHVEVRNPKGETIYAKDHVTDPFGALTGTLKLKEDAPLGLYRIQVSVAGDKLGAWASEGNRFRVEQYKKPEFKVAVEPGRPDYRVGDEMKIKIVARYYFGQPVADAQVRFTIRKQSYAHRHDWPRPWKWYYQDVHRSRGWRPWWQPRFDELVAAGTTTTDANGQAFVTVAASPIKGHEELDLKFVVNAEVTDASRRVIRGAGEVKVTHAPFFVYARPAQAVYGPGDSVEININTEDPNGAAVAGRFTVEAWRIERVRKVVKSGGGEKGEFEEKLAQKVFGREIDVPETGRAAVRFVPDMTGHFKVAIRQADAPEGREPVEGSCSLWIASKTGTEAHYAYSDLKLIPAADQYEIGRRMKLLINTARADSYVLLTGEADDVLFWRVVHVEGNSKLVELPVGEHLTPNFTLTGTLIKDNKLYRDSKKIVVPPTHRFIKVEATAGPGSAGGGGRNGAYKYRPGEAAKLRIRLTDVRTGGPVVGQVAVMIVDSSIYYIQPEFRRAIEKSFYGYVRPVRVATADSFAGPRSLNPGVGRAGLRHRAEQARLFGMGADAAKKAARAPGAAKEVAGPEPLAESVVREHFRDTVLWAGSVVTDADGTAEIPFALPDQLATFAVHVISFDKDTRVGEAGFEVVATKRIIVRIESGRFFTEGDRGYVTVIAHNYFAQPQGLKVDLAASENLELRKVRLGGSWREYTSGDALNVTVPAGGEVRLDFLTTALRPGQVELVARARGTRESDAIKLTKPIVPWGAAKLAGAGGVLRGDGKQTAEWTFTVPEQIKAGSQSLTVTLAPSIAAVAVEALPFLARYPYGCVEQTMSRFLPTVVVRKTLQEAGVSLDDVRKLIEQRAAAEPKLAARYEFIRRRMNRNPVYSSAEIDGMVAKGIRRLADMQHGDGGWGWWKSGDSDPYMTAYVTYGLTVARQCDVQMPTEVLARAEKFLVDRASQPKHEKEQVWWRRRLDNDNTRAYVLYVLGALDPLCLQQEKLAAHLGRIYDARDDLTDYGRAYLALALHAAGRIEEAATVVANFENTAVVDAKANTVHWGRKSGWWYWQDGATETTAWVMQAMMTVDPENPHVPMAVNWLVSNRRQLAWDNTKATATAVFALMRYAKVAGELDCDQTFEVTIDDAIHKAVRVTRENLFAFDSRIEVAAEHLPPGPHTVRIARAGKGSLYWGCYLEHFTTAERIASGGCGLAVQRSYYQLVPEEFTNTRKVWKNGRRVTEEFPDIRYNRQRLAFGDEIASGELVEVELAVEADSNLEYMVFEDPKPAGCEPYRLTSGPSYGGGAYANVELRDTKVAFFASFLTKGKHTLSYRLVCEQPGTFRSLPAGAEAMYSPFVRAVSDSGKVVIIAQPGRQQGPDDRELR